MKISQKMKRIPLLGLLVAMAFSAVADVAPISVKWIMGKNGEPNNMFSSTFVIKNVSNKPLEANWNFYFNAFSRRTELIGETPQLDMVQFRPGYYKISPNANYKTLQPGESINVPYLTKHSFINISYKPDGGHFMFSDKPDNIMEAEIKIAPLTDEVQWTVPGNKFVTYPDGRYMYNRNYEICPKGLAYKGSVYDVFPTPKSVILTGKSVNISSSVTISCDKAQTELLQNASNYLKEKLAKHNIQTAKGKFTIKLNVKQDINKNNEYYKLTVGNKEIEITGATDLGVLNGVKTLISALNRSNILPLANIEDYPDLNYRGMMLDIARNFTNFENLKRYIDMLAAYKINIFQLHFNDDEGWRIEIPGIPELTAVGSRRGYTLDEKEFLMQAYTGNGNPNDETKSGNGHLTRVQFIELLQYAATRGVQIIPEIETPGHSRAAIVSLKARNRNLKNIDAVKANEYVVWDENDESSYISAQGYTDNVLNFAQEGTYRFIEKVVDELIKMYSDAGVKLYAIHIGGDEVPNGAWKGSPMVKKLMADNNMKTIHEGAEYFLDRVSEMIYKKGVKVEGWQELALHHSPEFNAKIAPRFGAISVWSTAGRNDSIPYHIANSNLPVVLSNVNNFYFDMIQSRHQDEPGLNWGGVTDEFTAWNALPYNMYRSARFDYKDRLVDLEKAAEGKPVLKNKKNIVGVQGQLWAETLRNFDMVTLYTFPRILGVAERGWNANPDWSEDYNDMTRYNAARSQYNLKIGLHELSQLDNAGFDYHVPQPGIIIEHGILKANAQYPGVEIRYTTDGSEPTKQSKLWTAEVPCSAEIVKAKAYIGSRMSVTTIFKK